MPPVPTPDADFGPTWEPIFQATRARLRTPSRRRIAPALLFALSAVAFFLAGGAAKASLRFAMIAGVLLFHESGHLAAMWAFGYRDLRVFFLPGFGAAASGVKEGAPAWQRAIVLFAGPLPGIAVACGLFAVLPAEHSPVRALAWMLFVINGFNLIPLAPLDGGRLLSLLFVGRSRAVEIAIAALMAVGLGALALALHAPLLAVISALTLLLLPRRYRIAGAARELRSRHAFIPLRIGLASDIERDTEGDLPASLESGEALERDLFCLAVQSRARPNAVACAAAMREIHDVAAAPPLSTLGLVALVIAYVAVLAISTGAFLVARH